MLAYITAPVQPHHRAMLEQAARGRCRIAYMEDGENCLETAEIIIAESRPQDLLQAKNLKWFHLVWAGADRYKQTDFPDGAKFTNGSGAYGVMIAEHMMACMLSMVRQLPHYAQNQKDHQ